MRTPIIDALVFPTQELLNTNQDINFFDYEKKFGNTDFIKLIEVAGIAGPYKRVTPWLVEDKEGHQKIHATGYSAVPFGEAYPPLIEFVEEFLEKNDVLGLPHTAVSKWRAGLETNIISLLGKISPQHENSKVFFSNSGAEAVECALKLVKAYKQGATYIINFNKSFHGKTLGALSVTANKNHQDPFRPLLPNVVTLPFNDGPALRETVKKLHPDNIIAIIMETVQGEGGVIVPNHDFIEAVKEASHSEKILLIIDEVQTGLGRGGYWFAGIEWAGLDPDIITLAKPLGGGIVPLGVTIAKEKVFSNMFGGLNCKTHSNTFGGGSLAMAVGNKALEILVEEKLVSRAKKLGEVGLQRLQIIAKKYPNLFEEVRGFGMLFALQFKAPVKTGNPLLDEFEGELIGLLGILALQESGVLGNFSINASRTVRLTPPLNIPEDLFNQIFDCIEAMAAQYQSSENLIKHPVVPKIVEFVNSTTPEAVELTAQLIKKVSSI